MKNSHDTTRKISEYNEQYRKLTGSNIKLGFNSLRCGQPNLWPHFADFVSYFSHKEIDLGLITNGFPEHVNDSVYEKFKWVRISITPPKASSFYKNGKFESQYILLLLKITAHCSWLFMFMGRGLRCRIIKTEQVC